MVPNSRIWRIFFVFSLIVMVLVAGCSNTTTSGDNKTESGDGKSGGDQGNEVVTIEY